MAPVVSVPDDGYAYLPASSGAMGFPKALRCFRFFLTRTKGPIVMKAEATILYKLRVRAIPLEWLTMIDYRAERIRAMFG